MTGTNPVAMLATMYWRMVIVLLVSLSASIASGADKTVASEPDDILQHANNPWTGDLDGMTRRGFVRILTVHNPLFFNFDGERQRGLVAEWGKMFEEHLANEIGRVRSPTVVLIPVARDELLPGLIDGRGDLVMGNLTITPQRQQRVDFGPPIHPDVDELVVTGPATRAIDSLDDLVDIGLYVRRSSSYFEHLQNLNRERESQGKARIPVTAADENLEDYDLLDMVNVGALEAIVVDSHKAAFWEQVFDRVVVHRELSIHSGNKIAWAMRKNSPQLMASITAFGPTVRKGSLMGNILINRYLGDTAWIDSVLSGDNRQRYDETIDIIKKYADRYDFDWLIIAAQAYQESRFDQQKRSPAGALGVMQLLPSTAADEAVGIDDITDLENNIHAGVKYLHWLRETYFSDPTIPPLDQVLFSFAAYNAGPGNMRRARQRARRLGFDANRWFGNVEIGMFRAVSGEPAAYVRNIYKYYITYQGLEQSRRARERALEASPGQGLFERTLAKYPLLTGALILGLVGGLIFWAKRRSTPG